MSWTVTYLPEDEMIEVVSVGDIFNEDARTQAAEVIAMIKQYDADIVLVDFSNASLEVSLANLYWLPDYYTQLGAPNHVRAAMVLPGGGAQREPYQFFQTACKNAGYNVRLFDERSAAIAWLHQFRPNPLVR